MNPIKNQENLIKGCVNGDRKAQRAVYELFYGKMLVVCLRYTNNADQAKDILQDGFIKVFANISKFSGEGSFEGWIRRVVVNTAIDFTRKRKKDFLLLGDEQSIEDFVDIVEEEEEEEFEFKAIHIIEAMQKLSPAYRVVFNLYVFENMKHHEIAEKLGVSVGTSKSNLAKAKKNIRNLLLKEHNQTNE